MHKVSAPRAEEKSYTHDLHGIKREDPYFWLRDRENPKVIDYLKAENDYVDQTMKPYEKLQEELFQEMKSRMKEIESSAPLKYGNFLYVSRYEAGKQYPIYTRHFQDLKAPEEIILDENALAQGHEFLECSGPKMSPNHELMAYACDTTGRRFYTIQIKNLKTGELLPVKIENVRPQIIWAADNKTFFYVMPHPETLRADKIFRYNIDTKKSELVYFEMDETFSVSISQSLSKKYLYLISGSTLSTEVQYIPLDQPNKDPKIFLPREKDHEYSVEDGKDCFYILTNWQAKNFRLMTAPLDKTDKKDWKEILPHREDTFITSIEVFKNYIAVEEKKDGLANIRMLKRDNQESYYLPFNDKSYIAYVRDNVEYDSSFMRYSYESLRQPESIYDFDLANKKSQLIKSAEVPNFNPDNYKIDRIWITARDGKKIPVTILKNKNHHYDSKSALLVYGYGSYGAAIQPWFNSRVLSLVDRGFVYAIAHIRGGNDLGRDWYDQGRTFQKINTFNDFIDCSIELLNLKYADPRRVYAMGGSAGGLLMGAVTNMRPDLYAGVVAQVPFVDIVTTMLDNTIPLTTFEYDEWGNPNNKKDFEYMLSYSPYDNVKPQAYPNILITTGLHDSQVQYWEPAKWTAKLRKNNTGKNLILLKTDLTSGHGGASGRFDSLHDDALEYAFLLMVDSHQVP